jgi:hypothetical protein
MSGLAMSCEPISGLEPNVSGGLRQSSAFGFVKTGKDFGLLQLFRSEHEPAPEGKDRSPPVNG